MFGTVALALVRLGLVSIETEGQDIAGFVHRLSETAGVKLSARGAVTRGTLVVRFNDVPLDTALDHIARVTGAEWKDVEGERVLTLSKETEQLQVLAETTARTNLVRDAQAKQTASVTTWDPAAARAAADNVVAVGEGSDYGRLTPDGIRLLREAASMTPGGRAARQVFALLDPKSLAGLEPGTRVVYSDSPTKVQKPFPKAVKAILQQFNSDRGLFRDRVRESLSKAPAKNVLDPRRAALGPDGPATRLLAACSRVESEDLLLVSVSLATSSGEIVGSGMFSVGLALTDPEPVVWSPLSEIDLANDSASYLSLLKYPFSKTLGEHLDTNAEISRLGERIASTEPLAWVQGSLLSAVAKAENRNLVAWVPDRALLRTVRTEVKPKFDASEVLGLAQNNWSCSVKAYDQWLELSPFEPARARSEYIDRTKWWKYLTSVKDRRTIALEDAAEYAAGVASPLCLSSFDEHSAMVFVTVGGSFNVQSIAWSYTVEPLRFIGHLSAVTRDALFKGLDASFSSLDGACKTALTLWVYGPDSPRLVPVDDPASLGTLANEVTESWPSGIPLDARVGLSRTSVPVLFTSEYIEKYQQRNPIAFRIADTAFVDEASKSDPAATSYQPGSAARYVLTLSSNGLAPVTDEYFEPPVAKEDGWVRFDQLPADIVKGIAEATRQAKAAGIGNPKSGPPPQSR